MNRRGILWTLAWPFRLPAIHENTALAVWLRKDCAIPGDPSASVDDTFFRRPQAKGLVQAKGASQLPRFSGVFAVRFPNPRRGSKVGDRLRSRRGILSKGQSLPIVPVSNRISYRRKRCLFDECHIIPSQVFARMGTRSVAVPFISRLRESVQFGRLRGRR